MNVTDNRALGGFGFKSLAAGDPTFVPARGHIIAIVPDIVPSTFAAASELGDDLPSRSREVPVTGKFADVTCTVGAVLCYYSQAQ